MYNNKSYFDWKDEVDYYTLCNSIKETIESFDGYYIIHDGIGGGLGHKFTSLVSTITLSLLLKRRAYCIRLYRYSIIVYMYDTFWKSTNNCLRFMKYNNSNANNQKLPLFHTCRMFDACYTNKNDTLSLLKDNLIIKDYRDDSINNIKLLNKRVQLINDNLNLSYKFLNGKDYLKVLLRIFSNPNGNMMNIINNDIKNIPKSMVGIHIRTGGYLANFNEPTYWITKEEVPIVINYINNTITKHKLSPSIYLTTDSDYIESVVTKQLSHYNFVKRRLLKRNHSRGHADYSSFEAALYDYFMIA